MRARSWVALAVLVSLALLPTAHAGDGDEPHAAARVAEKALEALKLRMDARIQEGELLGRAGRIEEALAAYRSVGELYEQGMAAVRDLVSHLGRPAAASPSAGPTVGLSAREVAPQPPIENAPPGAAQAAVERALRWLAAHQAANGSWQAESWGDWCDGRPVLDQDRARLDGEGKAAHDPGVTGLALVAFLGAGHTNRGKGPYAETIAKGLRYLKTIQDPEGCFGPRATQQYIYNHGICALAMVEAYGMTGSPIFRSSAQKALDFIAQARNPYLGWRYGIKPGDNDTSVTTWMVMCLKSAQLINADAVARKREPPFGIDEAAFEGARNWLDKVTDPESGRVGYVQRGTGPARPTEMIDKFPPEKSEAMTAAGIFARVLIGEDPRTSPLIQKGVDLVSRLPPVWNPQDGSIDMVYWYYGTQALINVGGKRWQRWAQALERSLVPTQRRDGDACSYLGSWDPIGPWGLDGGRVFSTALMCHALTLRNAHARAR